jgi:hypothetical protein
VSCLGGCNLLVAESMKSSETAISWCMCVMLIYLLIVSYRLVPVIHDSYVDQNGTANYEKQPNNMNQLRDNHPPPPPGFPILGMWPNWYMK